MAIMTIAAIWEDAGSRELPWELSSWPAVVSTMLLLLASSVEDGETYMSLKEWARL